MSTQKKSFIETFITFLVGAVAVFLGLSAITGDIGDASAVILISIVCTAGVGLVFWIPLAYGIGKLLMRLVNIKREVVEVAPSAESYISDKTRVLINYIKEAQEIKFNDEEITNNLLKAGWPRALVEDAFKRV